MRSYSPCLIAVLLAALLGASGRSPLGAQAWESAAGARPSWTPPFAPATPALLNGLQSFLKTPAGASLASQIPSFATVESYSPNAELDLRVMGALGAHLPPDFETRLTAVLRRPADGSEAASFLARTLGGAYQAAVPEVTKAVKLRARQVALSVAYGQLNGPELTAAAAQLERFGVYGPRVQDHSAIVRTLAAKQAMGHAQTIAANFLRQSQAADEPVPQAPPAGDEKQVPDAWKLGARPKNAQAKPNGQDEPAFKREPPSPQREQPHFTKPEFRRVDAAEFARRKTPPPASPGPRTADRSASAPKPNPLSKNFYERLGAAKGMSQAELKAAYRKASMLYHPDRYSSQSAEAIKALTAAFQRIQEAYQTLSDPKKRAGYDLELAKTASSRGSR